MIRISVLEGPDAGRTVFYTAMPIRVGRGSACQLVLSDAMVSSRHGEIVQSAGDLVYRDLQSRHGTVARLQGHTETLHDRTAPTTVVLGRDAHLVVGETLLYVEWMPAAEWMRVPTTLTGRRLSRPVQQTIETLAARLQQRDPLLQPLLALARDLHAAKEPQDVLDRVMAATFSMFPWAATFVVCMPTRGSSLPHMEPLVLRRREDADPALTARVSWSLIEEVRTRGQSVLVLPSDEDTPTAPGPGPAPSPALMAAPLLGERELQGIIQIGCADESSRPTQDDLDVFTAMTSFAAVALERARLSRSISEMFEGIVRLSVAAVDARDPATAGHSARVADLTLRLAEAVNKVNDGPLAGIHLDQEALTELRYAALMHDFGKVAVRERVLMKSTRLEPDRVEAVRERIESARCSTLAEAWAETARSLAQGTSQASTTNLEGVVRQRAHARLQRLQQADTLLVQYQPGRRVPPEDRETLRWLETETFVDSHGNLRQLLTPDEAACMRIESGTLTPAEWKEMQGHAAHSGILLRQIAWSPALARVPAIAQAHHEKLDGTGYPDGLRGEEISPQVRMLTIADIFDALTGVDRPYRKAATVEQAVEILRSEAAGGQLDAALVEEFINKVIGESVPGDLSGNPTQEFNRSEVLPIPPRD